MPPPTRTHLVVRSVRRAALWVGMVLLWSVGSADAPLAETGGEAVRFHQKLQQVTHFRNLRGLDVPEGIIRDLSLGDAESAVAALEMLAERGNRKANVALVRVQHWCGTQTSAQPAHTDALIAQLDDTLSAERAARAAGVVRAQQAFRQQAAPSCTRAAFDYRQIEARLREAAGAGDPASATELAKFVRDPAQRRSLLNVAMDQHYAPAYYAVATALLMDVQRGETTQNVSSIREWLKQAGRELPKAKLDLANCMALGCDGHPADASAARAFGIDAARDGEPSAFLSMARMPWGARMNRSQLLAWQYFGDRLNEAGCLGDSYVSSSTQLAQTISLLEKGLNPTALQAARSQADKLWNDFGERAIQENGCE